jgi:nucleotide-binding universal stress UspA family protein
MSAKGRKTKILVLMDLSTHSYEALKYTITMAKKLNCEIRLFNAFAPGDIVKSESQSVSLQELQKKKMKLEDTFSSIVEIIEAEGIATSYNYKLGPIRDSIQQEISSYAPDLIVIGVEKSLKKGKLGQFILNTFKGDVLFVNAAHEFSEDVRVCFVNLEQPANQYNFDLLKEINECTNSTLKIVQTDGLKDTLEGLKSIESAEVYDIAPTANGNRRVGPTEIADDIIDSISKFESSLLCLGNYSEPKSMLQRMFGSKQLKTEIIKQSKGPVLMLGTK